MGKGVENFFRGVVTAGFLAANIACSQEPPQTPIPPSTPIATDNDRENPLPLPPNAKTLIESWPYLKQWRASLPRGLTVKILDNPNTMFSGKVDSITGLKIRKTPTLDDVAYGERWLTWGETIDWQTEVIIEEDEIITERWIVFYPTIGRKNDGNPLKSSYPLFVPRRTEYDEIYITGDKPESNPDTTTTVWPQTLGIIPSITTRIL